MFDERTILLSLLLIVAFAFVLYDIIKQGKCGVCGAKLEPEDFDDHSGQPKYKTPASNLPMCSRCKKAHKY